MIIPVMLMGESVLMKDALHVRDFRDPTLRTLVADMWETMEATGGVGIAAHQVGISLQVVCFGFESSERYPGAPSVPRTVLINPVIEPLNEETEEGWEGCLSVPGMRGVVSRYKRIRYRGYDLDGNSLEREAEGFHARVVQHECDHLRGIVYPMRITNWRKFGFNKVLFPDLCDE